MSKTKTKSCFRLGDTVRVRFGVSDPDYDDLTIGGWLGTIAELSNGKSPTFLVRWSEATLKEQNSIYRRRCERDGFNSEEMWLEAADLELDAGGSITIEHPSNVVARPLSMDDQDDRIKVVFELTSDDPLPEADDESLLAYHKYLAKELSFPFEAEYSFDTGPFQSKTYAITVLGLLDPDEFPPDEYGLFCRARRDGERIELPLTEVEGSRDKSNRSNRRLVNDYSYWFVNRW